jgi:hypothetical protein
MTYYEELLQKHHIKLTDEQLSSRNAWFVSQSDQTRRFKPAKMLTKQQGNIAKVHKQTDQQKLSRQIGSLFH